MFQYHLLSTSSIGNNGGTETIISTLMTIPHV